MTQIKIILRNVFQSSSVSTVSWTDFTAVDDTFPNGATKGQIFKSLNFAFYNGNGYPPDTFFIALENNPNSLQWKII